MRNARFGPEAPLSADLAYAACPDCGSPVLLRLAVLSTDGGLYALGSCAGCADGATVKARYRTDPREWKALALAGVPVVSYG